MVNTFLFGNRSLSVIIKFVYQSNNDNRKIKISKAVSLSFVKISDISSKKVELNLQIDYLNYLLRFLMQKQNISCDKFRLNGQVIKVIDLSYEIYNDSNYRFNKFNQSQFMNNLKNSKKSFNNKLGRPSLLKNIKTQASQNPQNLVNNAYANIDIERQKSQTTEVSPIKQITTKNSVTLNENKKRRCRTEAKDPNLNFHKSSDNSKVRVHSLFSKQLTENNLDNYRQHSLPRTNLSKITHFNQQRSIKVGKYSGRNDINGIIESLDQNNDNRLASSLRPPNASKMSSYYLESCDRNQKKIQQMRNDINKAVLLTNIEKFQESTTKTIQILQDLRQFSLKTQKYKNCTQINQFAVICLYNIATNLKHLQKNQEAFDIYKKAHQYAVKNLSHNHHLTILLKKVSLIQRQQSKQLLKPPVFAQTSKDLISFKSKSLAGKRNSHTIQTDQMRNHSKLLEPISQENKNNQAYGRILKRSGVRQFDPNKKNDVQKLIKAYRYGLTEEQKDKPFEIFNVADIKMKPLRKNYRLDSEQLEKFKQKEKRFEKIYQNGLPYKIKKAKMLDKSRKQEKPKAQIIQFSQENKINLQDLRKQEISYPKKTLMSNEVDIKIQSQDFQRAKLNTSVQSVKIKQQNSWCQIF